MGKFIVELDVKSEFRWRLQASGNYETILRSSEGYTTKQNCLNSIASVKINSQIDERYRNGTSGYQYYFTLHSYPNGETLGISEMYTSAYSRDEGKKDVKREAKDATIDDRTPVSSYR